MEGREHSNASDAALMIGEWRVHPRADEIASDGRVIKLQKIDAQMVAQRKFA